MMNTAKLIGCLIVAAMELGASSMAGARWVQDGTPVCTTAGDQNIPLIVSDGQGGAIIAWTDGRGGNGDIYAQRISAEGVLLWDTGGVPVCTDSSAQGLEDIAPDGSGGAIIVWSDGRNLNADIYAQRLSAAGIELWTPGGVPVCTWPAHQRCARVVPGGAGEAIIAWIDSRLDSFDAAYAQKLTAAGSPAWTTDGMYAAGTDDCFATSFRAVSDSLGGAILVWCCTNGYLWGQRIDGDGNACWGTNGHSVADATSDPFGIAVVSDGFGGALVLFRDSIFWGGILTLDVLRAQRVAPDGTACWSSEIELDSSDFSYLAIAPDAMGGAIVVWQSDLNGSGNALIVQRLDAAGSFLWGSGRTVETNANCWALLPKVVPDGSGGAVVAWMDQGGTDNVDIYVQRLNRDGDLLWHERVPICAASGNQMYPRIATNCAGGAIVTWMDYRASSQGDIFAQTVDSAGVPGEPPVAVLLEQFSSFLVADGIEVSWTLSSVGQAMRFEAERVEGSSGGFEPLAASIGRDGLSYRLIDREVASGGSYQYRIFIDEGSGRRLLFETGAIAVPRGSLALRQNRPNPFNPSTAVDYYLPAAGRVTLDIFDVCGRLVIRLVDETQQRGEHSIRWSGLDAYGTAVSSGAYFYRLTMDKKSVSRKMLLCR
jgi:hypothetical protein